MKLRAEVVALAMKIEEALQQQEESLKSFEKSFGSKYSDPQIGKVNLELTYTSYDSSTIHSEKFDQECSLWQQIK